MRTTIASLAVGLFTASPVWLAPSVASADCQCSGTGIDGPVTVACGQTVCGTDSMAYSCGADGFTGTGQPCSSSCSCSGTGLNGPVTVSCGQSVCGTDSMSYSCTASGFAATDQPCCSCSGTSIDGPVTVSCGQSTCGTDGELYTCTSSGFTDAGSTCTGGTGAGGSGGCSCSGTSIDGPVTISCGQSTCGTDGELYTCTSSGFTDAGSTCTSSAGAGGSGGTGGTGGCSCSGTGIDGPVTIACGQATCGTDHESYTCTSSGFVDAGTSCTGSGAGGTTSTGGSSGAGGSSGGSSGSGGAGGTAGASTGGSAGAAGSGGLGSGGNACNVPAFPPSKGLCGAKLACDPVTNGGCTTSQTCSYDATKHSFGCVATSGGLPVCSTGCGPGAPCVPGATCLDEVGGATCVELCCDDADCGQGSCRFDVAGFGGAASNVGVCSGAPGNGSGGSPTAPPSQLVTTGSYTIAGITSDDWVVLFSTTGLGISVVPLSGGTPKVIDATAKYAWVKGTSVLSMRSDGSSPTIWTSKLVSPIVFDTRALLVAGLTTDGAYAVYAATTDGTNGVVRRLTVATGVAQSIGFTMVADPSCASHMYGTATRIVTSTGPCNQTTVRSVEAATGVATVLEAASDYLLVDPQSERALVGVNTDGSGHLFSLATTTQTSFKNFFAGLFLPVSGDVVVADNSSHMNVVTPSGSTIQTFTYGIFTSLKPLYASPTGQTFLYNTNTNGSGTYDLSLATLTGGRLSKIAPFTTAYLYGDSYTTDGEFVVYFDNVDLNKGIGTLDVAAIENPVPIQIATNVWVTYSPKNETIVYNDAFVAAAKGNGTTNLQVLDLSQKAVAPLTLATGIDAEFKLNAAKDKVAYSKLTGTPGIYSVAIP